MLTLHAARGWRLRPCPACKARPGERCFTPRGRPAARPHTARLHLARRELHALEDVWRALERSSAKLAVVRFTGGGGRQGTLERVSIQAAGRELAGCSSADEPQLASALAAPVWGRYGAFKGQPPITATLRWSVADRSLTLAGTRGSERFEEILQAATATVASPVHDTSRDMSLAGPRPPAASAADAGSRSQLVLARRRATAQSAAGRPPRAPGCASVRPRGARAAQALCRLRRPDAGRGAAGGALLLKALPAGRLARPARARTPISTFDRAALSPKRKRHVARRVAL